jgi:ketosteroid isomerase-like protein
VEATAIATDLLRRWSEAIARRNLDEISALFAPDAVFVATAPAPLIGRQQIRAYYEGAPAGLTARASLVLASAQSGGLAIVADVAFDLPAGRALTGRLCLACGTDQVITLYHLAVAVPAR